MTVTNVLNCIGWVFLISSWVVPYVMRKMGKDGLNASFIGAVLAAVSCGIFLSNGIMTWMR